MVGLGGFPDSFDLRNDGDGSPGLRCVSFVWRCCPTAPVSYQVTFNPSWRFLISRHSLHKNMYIRSKCGISDSFSIVFVT